MKYQVKNIITWFRAQSFAIRVSLVLLTIIIVWFSIGLFIPRQADIEKPLRGKGEVVALVRKETEQEVYKVISGYGRINRDMVQLVSEINSNVSTIYGKEGTNIRRGAPVVGLLNDVIIRSPISGKLDTINVVQGDVIFAGQTIMFSVISQDKLDVEMQISANDAREVKVGNSAKIELEKDVFSGKVYFVSKSSDKNNNTFRVKIKIDKPDVKDAMKAELFHGESVKINIETVKKNGFFVPTSALSLGADQEKIVKFIDAEGIVRETEVDILQTTQTGLWVSGDLPHTTMIITRGGDFLKTGEPTQYKIEE